MHSMATANGEPVYEPNLLKIAQLEVKTCQGKGRGVFAKKSYFIGSYTTCSSLCRAFHYPVAY